MTGNKQTAVILAIFVVGTILFANNYTFEIGKPAPSRGSSIVLPSFSLPSFKILPANDAAVTAEAWMVFEKYLEFAKNHDLPGLRSLSHQISATCNDPAKENDCFALMDSVYSFAGNLKLSEFKHIQSDERQIIMYTDGPAVAMLYFTRNKNDINDIKVLGMRFCFEDEQTVGTCVKTDSIKHDVNGNGWWDSVESLFY